MGEHRQQGAKADDEAVDPAIGDRQQAREYDPRAELQRRERALRGELRSGVADEVHGRIPAGEAIERSS